MNVYIRRAFFAYKRHFPSDAEQLFLRLDSAAQKQIERERLGSLDSLHHIATGMLLVYFIYYFCFFELFSIFNLLPFCLSPNIEIGAI